MLKSLAKIRVRHLPMHEPLRFPIEPIDRFAKQSGTRQPVELTSFSFDQDRVLKHDDSSLSYYWPISRSGTSLSGGFDKLISRDESIDEHIDALLSSLIRYELVHGNAKTNVDIISWRGMITKFLTLPFARGDGFEMNVTRLGDTIYLEEYTSPEARFEKTKRESDARQKLMAYWGYKYEALATIPRIWNETSQSEIDERDAKIVNTNVQYCSVVRTRLGPVSMILAGEVDCCLDYKPESCEAEALDDDDHLEGMRKPERTMVIPESVVDHYVELKTTKLHKSDRDTNSFERFKLLKFWAQSFLLGVPSIIVGFRDDEGFLRHEETFKTLKIPGMVRAGSKAWDGNICLNFAGDVLHFIKTAVTSQPGNGVWRIRYQRNAQEVELFRIADEGYGAILTPEYLKHKAAQ